MISSAQIERGDPLSMIGAAELIYLVGLYCLVSVTLNGLDVPVPEPSAA